MREETMGDLRARIAGGSDGRGGGSGPVVVLLHGFGAPGDDLVPLWRVLDVPGEVRFVFPEGPLSMGLGFGGGRAWWMIDMERLIRSRLGGPASSRAAEVPPGLAPARERMVALLDALPKRLGPGPLVLGGFSQGAMLSLDLALRNGRALAGLVLMSGTMLAEEEWTPLVRQRRGLPVLMSHGAYDPLLPFSEAERLRSLLTAGGLRVEWIPFQGEHEIPREVLDRLGAFIRDLALHPPPP